jgi:hypothetical protein
LSRDPEGDQPGSAPCNHWCEIEDSSSRGFYTIIDAFAISIEIMVGGAANETRLYVYRVVASQTARIRIIVDEGSLDQTGKKASFRWNIAGCDFQNMLS